MFCARRQVLSAALAERLHDGAEINIDEKTVDFVMGSGNHGRTYVHLTSRGTLQQLPLGWYSEKGGYWAMAPGYDRPYYPVSTRPSSHIRRCMFCHNAYPAIPHGHDEVGATPQFTGPLPEGIDCQRCHVSGAESTWRPQARRALSPAEIRAAIVNSEEAECGPRDGGGSAVPSGNNGGDAAA